MNNPKQPPTDTSHTPFRLDPPPAEWSLEWERAQLQKLADFDLYRLTRQELDSFADVIRYRRVDVVRRQAPLVREMLVHSLVPGHGLVCEYDPADVAAAWDYCETVQQADQLFSSGQYNEVWRNKLHTCYQALTDGQREIAGRLQQNWPALRMAYASAGREMRENETSLEKKIENRWKAELAQFREDYQKHLDHLTTEQQALTGYEIGRLGLSRGHSGFHFADPDSSLPFSVCGWADYHHPRWGREQGVAFRINRPCFSGRDALLYYLDDDGFPFREEEDTPLRIIRECSSGISCVRTDTVTDEEGAARRAVLFRLDEGNIRQTVRLSGRDVDPGELGGYVFVLPRAGEFYCQLGEVADGKVIPLHLDDFCMK